MKVLISRFPPRIIISANKLVIWVGADYKGFGKRFYGLQWQFYTSAFYFSVLWIKCNVESL